MKSIVCLVSLWTLLASVSAFSPAARPILTPGRLIQGQSMKSFVLQAEEKQEAEAPATTDPAATADGTYYDDEVEPAPKQGISDSMKERLMREASTGLDADQKQTNVLLYIIIGVAALVVVGGQGILY